MPSRSTWRQTGENRCQSQDTQGDVVISVMKTRRKKKLSQLTVVSLVMRTATVDLRIRVNLHVEPWACSTVEPGVGLNT